MIISLDNIITILRLILDLIILSSIIKQYLKFRYASLKYFMFSITLFIINDFIRIYNTSKSEAIGPQRFINSIYFITIEFVVMLLALYCMLLFFESFKSESPFTRRNLFLAIVLSSIITSICVEIFLIHAIFDKIFLNFSGTIRDINYKILPIEQRRIISLFIITSILGVFTAIYESILLLKEFESRRKNTPNIMLQKIYNQLKKSSFVIIIGIILHSQFENIGGLFMLIGIGLIFIFFMKGGMFMFQDQSLRRLLIIDDDGIHYYTFTFHEFDSNNANNDKDDLFSGAIKAVSSLLSTLIGEEQMIREIKLENAFFLLERTKSNNKYYSIILITDRSTRFYADALSKFRKRLIEEIGDIIPNATLINEKKLKISLF